MNKLIATMAILTFVTSCNNDSASNESILDSSIMNTMRGKKIRNSTLPSLDTTYKLPVTTGVSKNYVKIGDQEWTLNNLDVTTFRNGDIIPQITDSNKWASFKKGAWCYYDNDSSNDAVYGKLYNWYAVIDKRGLAPIGWHIPSYLEWTTLINFLGGDSFAGDKMKATTLWHRETAANNESGFTGFPGGYRVDNGMFATLGNFGNWWSSTEAKSGFVWNCILYMSNGVVLWGKENKNFGMSVRLIKDVKSARGNEFSGNKVKEK